LLLSLLLLCCVVLLLRHTRTYVRIHTLTHAHARCSYIDANYVAISGGDGDDDARKRGGKGSEKSDSGGGGGGGGGGGSGGESFREKDLRAIRDITSEKHLFAFLVHSLCPSIFGMFTFLACVFCVPIVHLLCPSIFGMFCIQLCDSSALVVPVNLWYVLHSTVRL
jgi:hypothetical protein